jgi:hypothetical protein
MLMLRTRIETSNRKNGKGLARVAVRIFCACVNPQQAAGAVVEEATPVACLMGNETQVPHQLHLV